MPWKQPCLQASIVETSGYLLGPCALASSARWGMALLRLSGSHSSFEVLAYSRFLLSHGYLRRLSISLTTYCPSDKRAAEHYHPSPRINILHALRPLDQFSNTARPLQLYATTTLPGHQNAPVACPGSS